jgi:ATP-dependent Lon protease
MEPATPKLRIPLFPLNVVLLPGNPLPLHIFESRYKQMIRTVVEQSAPFGVVRARDDGIFRVGCTAMVVRIVKAYEDGRMDIATVGQMPFRIEELHHDMPYLAATVQPLADDPQPGPAKITGELRKLFESCYRLAHGAAPADISLWPENDPEHSFAYQLAPELPLDLDALQELLEIRTETERRSRLVEQLGALLPRLVRISQMREKTGANGHGLN